MSNRVLVQFEVDNKGAITGIKDVNTNLEATPDSANNASAGISNLTKVMGALAVTLVTVKLKEWMSEAVDASSAQERTFATLANTIDNTGVSYADIKTSMDATFTSLQDMTRYGDTDSAEMLNKLAGLTGNYEISMQGLLPIMDMAVGTGKDVTAVTETIGKAITGNLGSLGRYGISLDTSTMKMLKNASQAERAEYLYGLLNDKWGGAAQRDLETYGGGLDRLGNYYGDLQERLGDTVTKSDGAKRAIGALTTEIQDLLVVLDPRALDLFATSIVDMTGSILQAIPGFEGLNDIAKSTLIGYTSFVEMHASLKIAGVADDYERLIKVKDELINKLRLEADVGGRATDEYKRTSKELNNVLEVLSKIEPTYTKYTDIQREAVDVIDLLVNGIADHAETLDDDTEATDANTQAVVDQAGAYDKLSKSVDGLIDRAVASQTRAILRRIEEDNQLIAEIQARLDALYTSVEYVPQPNINAALASVTGMASDFGQIITDEFGQVIYIPKAPRVEAKATYTSFVLDLSDITASTLADGIYLGFTGRLDEIGDVFAGFLDGLAGRSAENMTNILSDGLAKGGGLDNFDWSNFGVSAAIGLGAGFLASLFGGDPKNPQASGVFGMRDGHWVGGISTFDQAHTSADAQLNYRQQAYSAYTATRQGYYDVLREFNDQSLVDLVANGGHGSISLPRMDGSASDVFGLMIQTQLPEVFDGIFKDAFGKGLTDLGVTQETQDALSSELGQLVGGERLTALGTYVSALVGLTQLSGDMDWQAVLDDAGMDAITSFFDGMSAISDAVDQQFIGLDDLTLLEKADQATTIEGMMISARNAEVDMLRQIDSLQKGINQSWDKFDEGVLLGGMTEAQQLGYYQDQADLMLSNLQGATSLEDIQYYNSELLGYLGQIQGMVDLKGMGGDAWSDWLTDMSGSARDASDTALTGYRDDIQEVNQRLIDKLEELILALTTSGYSGSTGSDTGEDSTDNDDYVDVPINIVVPPPIVNVNVYNYGGGTSVVNHTVSTPIS